MTQFDARAFLMQLLESTAEGVFALDVQGRILVWNRSLERILGRSRDDAIGRHLYEVLPFFRETGEDWLVRDALGGRPRDSREQAFFLPDTGREGTFQASYLPLRDSSGAVIGVLGILRDLTPVKSALEAARQEARRRELALRRLLARRAESAENAFPPSSGTPGSDGSSASTGSPAAGRQPRPGRAPAGSSPGSPPGTRGPAGTVRSPGEKPKMPSTPLPEDPDSQIFDRRAALGALGSDAAVRDMMEAFLASLPAAATELDRAVVGQDFRSVAQQIEPLKNAVAVLGGHRATWVAARLELLAQEGKGNELRPMWLRLRRELALMREAMMHLRRRAA